MTGKTDFDTRRLICSGSCPGKDRYIGAEAHQRRTLLNIRWPIQGTRVENWDDVEALWHHVFYYDLKVEPKEHPLLITAPLSLTPWDR
jgi:actin-related protein